MTSSPVEAELDYDLGHPGGEPDIPHLIQMVFDNSASICAAQGGGDPIGQRFDEAAAAIRNLQTRTRGRSRSRTRIQVRHFDVPSRYVTSPGFMKDRGHMAQVYGNLRVPPDVRGSSSLGPVLGSLEQDAQRGTESGYWPQLIVFSDFLLTDPDLDGLYQRLGEFPGEVHAVCLGQPPSRQVQEAVDATYYIATDAKPGAVARSLSAALTANRPNAEPVDVSDVVLTER
ncbi:hypothetical protein [Nesterenkonia muleiensis]|uniref:hypothetical protein n=1 Tax=Nesterenkonia muleiensis TaxID=2282648 RepID=UPI0013003128|nr:hypothetical protein [Nesterenkonia muleiensis]